MNLSTLIVLAVVIAIVYLATHSIYKDKKAGRSLCGGNCGHCGCGSSCENPKQFFDKIREEQFSD